MPNSVGRPRDEQVDRHILDAVAGIMTEKGYSGLTMEAVATKAGVSKHTLYLRYKSPAELVFALLTDLAPTHPLPPDTGAFRTDLLAVLKDSRWLLQATPIGVAIPSLLGAGSDNPELIRRLRAYLNDRRKHMLLIVERAVKRSELPQDTDGKALIESCVARLYYRHVISGEKISDSFLHHVVDSAVASCLPRAADNV